MMHANTPHSSLSPLTPGSVAYPDGLITPTWVRKHSEILPSVFVHFARLYEHSFSGDQAARSSPTQGSGGRSRAGSLLDATDPINVPIPPTPAPSSPSLKSAKPASDPLNVTGSTKELEKQRRESEKRADEELVKEIADRRKKLVDKVTGIKMTVVLMASRDALGTPLVFSAAHEFRTEIDPPALDDTGLDSRLSFIRRQSGLDTKASLFVLTPVSDDELEEFVAR